MKFTELTRERLRERRSSFNVGDFVVHRFNKNKFMVIDIKFEYAGDGYYDVDYYVCRDSEMKTINLYGVELRKIKNAI